MGTKYIDFKNSLPTCNEIENSVNTTGILKRSVWVIVGIILFIIGIGMDPQSSAIQLSLISIGGLFVLMGIWTICTHTRHWIYRPTKSPLQMGQLRLGSDYINAVYKAIHEEDFSTLQDAKENMAGGVKLEYAIASDKTFGIIQMALYEGYTFVPGSDIIKLEGTKAQELARLFKR